MKKNLRFLNLLLVATLLLSFFMTNISAADDTEISYPVIEDAYVRSTKGTSNFNSEEITKAHGAQYEGKGIRVINSKIFSNGGEIIALMKFDLPTLEEVEVNGLNKYDLQMGIFKNPNFSNSQTYLFHYTSDVSWSESTVTWNNKPDTVNRNNTNILTSFHIASGTEYEKMTDEEQIVRLDITAKIMELIKDGHTSITIFITAVDSKDTSLMIHSKESAIESKRAKIVASSDGITKSKLQQLVSDAKEYKSEDYESSTFNTLQTRISEAEDVLEISEPTYLELQTAYNNLLAAISGLIEPTSNIAFKKPVRSNYAKKLNAEVTGVSSNVEYVVDGDPTTGWTGKVYPAYVDIDLMDRYTLEEIVLHFPDTRNYYYSIYGSNDGSTYDLLHKKRDDSTSNSAGNTISIDASESYRIIRVYLEYTQGHNNSFLNEVEVYGEFASVDSTPLRTGSLEEVLGTEAYEDSIYAGEITTDETIDNVYGVIERTIGAEYKDWFTFEIKENTVNDNDYYEISFVDGKVHIVGNEGVSLTSGLNYYYKNYLNVNISEQTMQIIVPETVVTVTETVRKETPYKIRYAYNYCTLSYTFAFFGVDDWQKENDWLALNGVNLVLDLAGQEATWIEFLMNFGYSFDDAKDWITGPGYVAWQFMGNMEQFGGPIPDGYVVDRIELARSSQRWKNSLGMTTILQGYSGMVPTNFAEFQPEMADKIIAQKSWGNFSRPSMIATNTPEYIEYAKMFYDAQEYVYGKTSDYYAVDPFHEGGTRPADGSLPDSVISEKVLDSLLDYDDDAVWVIQAWQSNPTNGLLQGMGDRRNDHVLVVDLIKYPLEPWTKYNRLQYKDSGTKLESVEFNGTNWVWGLLANFGGNPSMHGQLEEMVTLIMKARKESNHMQGIGLISEGTYDNPIVYDLLFDLAWAEDDFNLKQWVNKYTERRYGVSNDNAKLAWSIMLDSNYDYGVRFTEEIYGTKYKTPDGYKSQTIAYGADKLETAFRLLIEDYDALSHTETYRYDLTEVMRQVVSNYSVLTYNKVLAAKDSNDLEAFQEHSADFIKSLEILNKVQATQQDQLGGEWIGKAQDLAANYDDFTMSLFEMNAKSLISTWGSRASYGNLKDYGWRNYEGIFEDIYAKNWIDYLAEIEKGLEGKASNIISKTGYFDIYWKWVVGEQDYLRVAKNSPEDIKEVIDLVLEHTMIGDNVDPNAGNLALGRNTEVEKGINSGLTTWANDGLDDTALVVNAADGNPEVIVELIGEFDLSKASVLMGNNNPFRMYISADKVNWTEVEFEVDNDTATIANVTAKYVKIVGTENQPLSIIEVRAYGSKALTSPDQLKELVESYTDIEEVDNSSSRLTTYKNSLATAQNLIDTNEEHPETIDSVYWELYDAIAALNLSEVHNVVLEKATVAHNDPDGNSKQLVDGNLATRWNSGRLSPTGQPYKHDPIMPGHTIVDLNGVYNIGEISLDFNSKSIWYNYELYVSMDNENWVKIAENTSQNTQNYDEDTFYFDTLITAKYIKFVTTNIQLETESPAKRNGYYVNELIVKGIKIDVDLEALKELIASTDELVEGNYTTASWEQLQQDLEHAQNIVDSSSPTENDVQIAYSNLGLAISNLVDISKLAELVEDAQELVDADIYTTSTSNLLQEAIDDANDLLVNEDVTNEDVNDAIATIEGLILALQEKADYTDYNTLKDQIDAEDLSKYTEESVEEVNRIIEQIEALDANEVSQDELDELCSELETAFTELELISVNPEVEKNELSQLIIEAKLTNKDAYTEDSYNILSGVIVEAEKVLNDSDATQDDVDKAISDLQDALGQLETKPLDLSRLEKLVNEALLKKQDEYTVASWKPFSDKLAQAEQLLNTVRSRSVITQEHVDNAETELRTAMSNLKLKTAEPDTAVRTNYALWIVMIILSAIVLVVHRKKKFYN